MNSEDDVIVPVDESLGKTFRIADDEDRFDHWYDYWQVAVYEVSDVESMMEEIRGVNDDGVVGVNVKLGSVHILTIQ